MNAKTITIAIADDHEMIRIGLDRVLGMFRDMTVTAKLADAHAVLQTDFSTTDVLLLDMNMPGSDGISLIAQVLDQFADLKIVVFSMLPEESYAPRALAAGAAAFLSKNQPPEEVVTAIRKVVSFGHYRSEAQEDMLLAMETVDGGPLHRSLSQREFEILVLIAGGAKPTDVAKRLELKIGTVTTHVHRIKRKLGARSLGDLVAYGHQNKLLGS